MLVLVARPHTIVSRLLVRSPNDDIDFPIPQRNDSDPNDGVPKGDIANPHFHGTESWHCTRVGLVGDDVVPEQ